MRTYGRATENMLTTLAVSADARVVVAGSSEGELIVLDGRSLSKLKKIVAHDLFITNLLLRSADTSGLGALAGDSRVTLPWDPILIVR